MISIRLYTAAYKNSVFSVYKNCEDFLSLGPVSIASMKMVEEDLLGSRENNGTFCVIEYDNKIVGIIDYIPFGYEGNPENAFLSLIMIAKDYRSKGIGDIAVAEVEKIITENKTIKMIFSGVQTNNERAISFWIKHGYKIIRACLKNSTRMSF